MPYQRADGTAVKNIHEAGNGGTFVSWADLAHAIGNPSLVRDAEFEPKAYYRQQAQDAILAAYNRRRQG